MTDIPKLDVSMTFGSQAYIVRGKDKLLTEPQATEIIRQVEAYPEIIGLLTYFYNLPCHGISSSSQHLAKLELAKPYIEGKPKTMI